MSSLSGAIVLLTSQGLFSAPAVLARAASREFIPLAGRSDEERASVPVGPYLVRGEDAAHVVKWCAICGRAAGEVGGCLIRLRYSCFVLSCAPGPCLDKLAAAALEEFSRKHFPKASPFLLTRGAHGACCILGEVPRELVNEIVTAYVLAVLG